MDEEELEYSETAHFVGECTCSHTDEDHDWGSCGLEDCLCEAGWEE